MSRNLTFFLLGLISIILTYFFHSLLVTLIGMVITENLSQDYMSLLVKSDLVALANFISFFGLVFFALYLIFPVTYVLYHLIAAKNILKELPLISNPMHNTDKATFLSKFKDFGFISDVVDSYSPYLIQGAEQDVKAETLKNIRVIKKAGLKNARKSYSIAPVKARVSAATYFNEDRLVKDNLLMGFFIFYARIMVAIGTISLGISIVAFSLKEGQGPLLFSGLQSGGIAFLYCLTTAVIITGIGNIAISLLSQEVKKMARMIDNLFFQSDWQQDLCKIKEQLESHSTVEKFEIIMRDSLDKTRTSFDKSQNSFDKSMIEISKAVTALSVEQESKLDDILSKTLVNFSHNMEKKSETEVKNLNKTLKDMANSAEQMTKNLSGSNIEFSKQMDKQASAIVKHIADMQKVLITSEKATQKSTEKIITTLATEVQSTYVKLGDFMDVSLKKLDEKQKKIEESANDKNSIIGDLNQAAKDLATISNASGQLLEKFTALSTELNLVLLKAQGKPGGSHKALEEKRDKIKMAMLDLKKANRDKIDELPDM